MIRIAAGELLLDAVIVLAACLVIIVLVAGVVVFVRAGRPPRDASEVTGVPDSLPTIADAASLPSVSGRFRILVRVFTLHRYVDDAYHDREVRVADDMFAADILHQAFPAIGRLAQEPMQMPVEGEALYRVYVCTNPIDRLMAYRQIVKRSGTSADADANDDAAFLSEVMRMLAAAADSEEDTGTDRSEKA